MTTKDINIGQDKWIKWIDFDSDKTEIFNIDLLLEDTWDFWKLLEKECVVSGCGIDSFSFGIEDIQKVLPDFDKLTVVNRLKYLKGEIQKNHCKTIESLKLNNLFNKAVFTELLEHILNNIIENFNHGERYEYKRLNFIEKTQRYFLFLETEFEFDKPIHTFSIQPNGAITSDKIKYKNNLLNKELILLNAYHPVDYGFEVNLLDLESGGEEMISYVLKEKQDIEQEYLREQANILKEHFKNKIQPTNDWL